MLHAHDRVARVQSAFESYVKYLPQLRWIVIEHVGRWRDSRARALFSQLRCDRSNFSFSFSFPFFFSSSSFPFSFLFLLSLSLSLSLFLSFSLSLCVFTDVSDGVNCLSVGDWMLRACTCTCLRIYYAETGLRASINDSFFVAAATSHARSDLAASVHPEPTKST